MGFSTSSGSLAHLHPCLLHPVLAGVGGQLNQLFHQHEGYTFLFEPACTFLPEEVYYEGLKEKGFFRRR